MTTTTLHRPPQARSAGSNFTGTVGLLRLYLRRDRIVLPLWVLLLSVPLATVYIGSIQAVYPTQADRAAFAATIMASPAQRALYGNVYSDSLGAVGIWKAGMFHVLIAVAVILTLIRHTRADEETGRSELIDSTAVGRYANLTAALILSAGASVPPACCARTSRPPGRWRSARRWPAQGWCSPRWPRWPRSCPPAPGAPEGRRSRCWPRRSRCAPSATLLRRPAPAC
jgi:ABC-2 type transport system permease protein